MNPRPTYHQKYFQNWHQYTTSLDRVLAENTFEKNWHLPSDLPDVPATSEFSCGYLCALADDMVRAHKFLRRAVDFADRTIAEERYLDTEIAEAGHPRELASILRARAHSSWLLGHGLDRRACRKAAKYFAEWCLTKAHDRRRFNDSVTMCLYLAAVRAAILGCDLDYAGHLLKLRTGFRWHHATEYTLWCKLISAYPDLSDVFDEEFEVFFDRVRDPDFQDVDAVGPTFIERSELALDTGLIRQMYVINASPHDDPDLREVLTAIAR